MRYIILLTIVLFCSACSRSYVAYRFFNDLAVSKTDNYFDLTSQQRDQLKKDIETDMDHARKDLFPQVAKTLRKIAPEVRKEKIQPELVAGHYDEFQSYFKKVSSYFKPAAIKTALTFKPAQYDHFAKELRKELKQSQEKMETQEYAQREIFKRYRRSIEFWIGGISSQQKDKLNGFISVHPYPWKLENQNKEFVLKQFLESRQDREKLKKFVADFYDDYESVRLPEFTHALDEHKKAFRKFLTEDFWQSLSPAQKNNLKDNLIARAEELENLAQRP